MVPASHALFNFFLDIFTPPKLRICMLYRGFHLQITLNLLESALFVYTTRMPCLSKTSLTSLKKTPAQMFSRKFCEIFLNSFFIVHLEVLPLFLVTFTEEILNRKLHCLCSEVYQSAKFCLKVTNNSC